MPEWGPDVKGDDEVALSDWIQGGIDIANAWGQQPVSQVFSYGGPATVPTVATPPMGTGDPYYNGAGQRALMCKRRKRQRNILTQANIGIMWQISNLPNNANVRIALAKAIR